MNDNPENFRYLALLRGINVGGKNIIRMSDLKICFEKIGFNKVQTYIQSGNVIFSSPEQNMEVLTDTIGQALSEMFGYKAKAAIISQKQLIDIVNNAPAEIGADRASYKYDVLFLMKPLTPEQMLKALKPKEGVDFVYTGESVLYFSRLIEKASQSRLNKIIGTPEYQHITIRNWRTTVKLKEIMESFDFTKINL